MAKLTAKQAQAVIDAYKAGERNWTRLGRQFGIGATQAKRIVEGEQWRDLDRTGVAVITRKYRKLSDSDVAEIRASSELQRVLATRFNVSHSLISLVKLGANYVTLKSRQKSDCGD